ncbi:MAG: oligosaccharide flippase family protein [Elusimicrobiota bacterium]
MSTLKKNIIANFSGKGWAAIMNLIFVPLYIKFMGIESYGLVGIFSSLLSIFGLLDMGISTTLNREMARLSTLPGKDQEMRDFVRTLETIYWAVGLFIALAVIALSSPIANHWVHPEKLSPSTVQKAIIIMGCIIAFQWPLRFYSGGLMGLQKQVLFNVIDIVAATLRGAGSVFILWKISPTIQAFFIWQIIISFFQTLTTAIFLWKSLPKTGYFSRFQKKLLLPVWRFSAGLTGISVVSLILTQTDKIILSRMLSLEMFGYYTLAIAVSHVLYNFYGPVYTAVFPRFCQLISVSDYSELKALYHKSCQLLSVMVLPSAVVICLFSQAIMFLWTGNHLIVSNTQYLISVLVIGTALNGLMQLPAGLMYADGWTKLSFYTDLIGVVILIPMMIFLVNHYGAIGAAVSWLILNFGYVSIIIHIMHTRLLKNDKWRWYFIDVGVPLVGALTVAFIWRIFIPDGMSRYAMFAYLSGASITTLILSAILTPYTRSLIAQILLKFKLPSFAM